MDSLRKDHADKLIQMKKMMNEKALIIEVLLQQIDASKSKASSADAITESKICE